MSTKEKIITKTLSVFNRQGCANASMRSIAEACDMSLSNLQHHFKTKEDLLEAIFDEMCLVYDGTSDYTEKGISLELLQTMSNLFGGFQKKYKFFFVEINMLMQQYPSIRKKMEAIKKKRMKEYIDLFNAYVKVGLFKPEPYPHFFNAQVELLWFVTNYFMSYKLSQGVKDQSRINADTNLIMTNMIYSLLTDSGIAQMIALKPR